MAGFSAAAHTALPEWANVSLRTVKDRVPKVMGEKKLYNTPDSPKQKILAESLPAKYNDQTELKLDVQRGENRQDFSLTTH